MKKYGLYAFSVMCLLLFVTAGSSDAGSPPTASVNVVNTPANPVPVAVRPVTPVMVQKLFTAPLGTINALGNLYDVPAGKRLVIQYYSCKASVLWEAGEAISCCAQVLETGDAENPLSILFCLPTTPFTPIGVQSPIAAGQPVTLYVDGPQTVQYNIFRSGPAGGTFPERSGFVSISGYLENIP